MSRPFQWRWYVTSTAAMLVCGFAQATPPDLLDVYHAAQLSDPALRSAQFSLDVARQKLPEARAGLFPVVSLNGNLNSTGAVTQFTGTPSIARDASNKAWTLQLIQPIFRIGNVIANHQAEFIVSSAEAQFDQARQDLIVRVAEAYFAINEAQDAIGATDSQIAAMTEQMAQVADGVKFGTKSVTDVDDIKTRLASARSQRVAAQNDLENARSDLEKITGESYISLAPLQQGAILSPPSPMDVRSWIDQARDNHPIVRAQTAALEAARLDVQRALAEHFPTFDLVINSVHNYSSHSLTTPDDYATHGVQHQVGVQISVPLFAGGAVVSKVATARGNAGKAEADLDTASRSAASDAQRAFAGVISALAQVDALNIAVQSGANALKGNQAGFRVGVRTNVDVLNAEQQAYSAQRDLSKARYQVLLEGIKLKAAAGILSEADLDAMNHLFR